MEKRKSDGYDANEWWRGKNRKVLYRADFGSVGFHREFLWTANQINFSKFLKLNTEPNQLW